LLQAGQRPRLDSLRQHQPPPQVPARMITARNRRL
jgi:hypothetical protein